MTTELQTRPTNQISFSNSQLDIIRNDICKGATSEELEYFLNVCKRSGLDPFSKQIYSVKRRDKIKGEVRSIQTSIDGYRLIAHRTGICAGIDEAIFDDEKKPNKATVTVYRLVGGVRCPFTATARWIEYYPQQNGFMWDKMPCVMLGKCAEALALRKAFPAEMSGLYTNEEMAQADNDIPFGRTLPQPPAFQKPLEHKAIEPSPWSSTPSPFDSDPVITIPQGKRLFAIAKANRWDENFIKEQLKIMFGLESTKSLKVSQYNSFIKVIESNPFPEEDVPFFDGPAESPHVLANMFFEIGITKEQLESNLQKKIDDWTNEDCRDLEAKYKVAKKARETK